MQREKKSKSTPAPAPVQKPVENNHRSERVIEYVQEDEFKKNMDRITKKMQTCFAVWLNSL